MKFKRFGENGERQWYELENGDVINCDEETINTLWCNWVTAGNSRRADTDKYTVFEFINPIELDLETAERW